MSKVYDYFLNIMLENDVEYEAWLDEQEREFLSKLDENLNKIHSDVNRGGSPQAKGDSKWQKEN